MAVWEGHDDADLAFGYGYAIDLGDHESLFFLADPAVAPPVLGPDDFI
jgi:hypothetical protein